MAADTVLAVENLGKRYVISHETRHDTLRDALSDGVRGALNRILRGGARQGREEFWALRDVSFEVKRGEIVGIIGANGAGKTTLLKILSRITEPSAGRVRLRGRVASLLEVGTGFHPELSGRENIFLNGAMLGMSLAEIRRKFDEIVAFAEVERFLDTPVKRYSSGMYVRLAFAVAAHLEPEILIVDEVLAVGDAAFQRKCIGKMQQVTTVGGRTVLLVSHNQTTIETLCTKGILLERGAVVESGPVSAIYRRYRQNMGAAATIRTSTPWLHWDRLENLHDLQRLKCSDPVSLRFRVRTGSRPIEGIEFDCALVNERGTLVTHARSRFLGRKYRLEPGRQYDVTFRFPRPHLAPGGYTATLYAIDETGTLLWLEDIAACRVLAQSDDFAAGILLDGVLSATLPPFTIEVE